MYALNVLCKLILTDESPLLLATISAAAKMTFYQMAQKDIFLITNKTVGQSHDGRSIEAADPMIRAVVDCFFMPCPLVFVSKS